MSEPSRPLRAVLVDAGGTLSADGPAPPDDLRGPRVAALVRELSGLDPALALVLADELERASNEAVDAQERAAGTAQRTEEILGRVTAGLGVDPTLAPAIRRAIASSIPCRELFPGGLQLFDAIASLGLGCAVVSNTFWWGADEIRRRFEGLSVASAIGTYVTSPDVGVRKPDSAMFRAALGALGRAAAECAFIGNSERADIEPAVAMGMRAIRVAIEEPIPETSAADAVVDSLASARLLRSWV